MPLPPLHRGPRIASRAAAAPGFTLIELLVTIGIMIFVLGISVVGFNAMFRTTGIKRAAQLLRAAVDGARVRAIQQGRPTRFEAQLVAGSTTHQWRVCLNAGDQAQEWRTLPEFVALATNAWQGASTGTDGRASSYRGAAGEGAITVQRICVTFGPDGSVKRFLLGGARLTGDSFTDLGTNADVDDPTGLFAIRLSSMRDVQSGQPPRRWLVFIPLTGGVQAYDIDGESF